MRGGTVNSSKTKSNNFGNSNFTNNKMLTNQSINMNSDMGGRKIMNSNSSKDSKL